VFDPEDLVEVLRAEKCRDIVVVSVPKELAYVDAIVVVTCTSRRHLRASATFVRKMFKLKRGSKANMKKEVPPIEGFNDKNADWLAIDLGNIALHFYLQEARLPRMLASSLA